MPNIAELVRVVGEQTGNMPDAILRARYLREAKIIPRSAKSPKDPQIEVVHCVSLLLGVMASNVQSQVPDAVREIWALPATTFFPMSADEDGNDPQQMPFPFAEALTYGQAVADFMEQMLGMPPGERQTAALFDSLTVWRDRRPAEAIRHAKRLEMFGNNVDTSRGRRKPVISTFSSIPYFGVWELVEMVAESRAEAARRRMQIPVHEAYEALGQPIPSLFHYPDGPNQPSGTPKPTPESKTAATRPLPGADATVANGQPATELDEHSSHAQSREEREKAQSPSDSRAGHSPQRVWSDPHEDPGTGRTFRTAA